MDEQAIKLFVLLISVKSSITVENHLRDSAKDTRKINKYTYRCQSLRSILPSKASIYVQLLCSCHDNNYYLSINWYLVFKITPSIVNRTHVYHRWLYPLLVCVLCGFILDHNAQSISPMHTGSRLYIHIYIRSK